eukprot:scaffold2117_cov241-Pinguiococcus_pyrenoidosus.AAC.11
MPRQRQKHVALHSDWQTPAHPQSVFPNQLMACESNTPVSLALLFHRSHPRFENVQVRTGLQICMDSSLTYPARAPPRPSLRRDEKPTLARSGVAEATRSSASPWTGADAMGNAAFEAVTTAQNVVMRSQVLRRALQ